MNARENIREAIKEMLLDNNIGTNEWSESKWPSGYYGWISGAMIRDLLWEYDDMRNFISSIEPSVLPSGHRLKRQEILRNSTDETAGEK